MNNILHKHLLSNVCWNAEGGAGGGGAGGGDSGGAGAGAGAGAGVGTQSAWYEHKDLGFDDETKTYYAGKKYPDLATALKSGREAEKVATSRNVFEKPDPKKLDEWKGWSELGWIEDAAKYEVKAPDQAKLKFPYNAEVMGSIKASAHKHRVPLAAAQAIHDDLLAAYGKHHDGIEAQGASRLAELSTALDEAWGADKERNTTIAQRAARTIFKDVPGVDFKKLEEAIGGAPALLKALHAHGVGLGESNLVGGDGGGGRSGLPASAAETQAEIRRLEADPDFRKVLNEGHRNPRYQDVMAQRQRLIDHLAKLQRPAA